VRWVAAGRVHLTVKFLGEISEADIDRVTVVCHRVCRGLAPFSLTLKGVGAFPGLKRPRVLWVGLGGDLNRLASLQQELETALEGTGFPRENRPFSPHLTVGRIRSLRNLSRLSEILSHEDLANRPFPVHEVGIYRSVLGPQGPTYTKLASCRLTPP